MFKKVSSLALIAAFPFTFSQHLRTVSNETSGGKRRNIVGFWHIGPSNYGNEVSRDKFVKKQAHEILNSYMFKEGLKDWNYDINLNYVTRVKLKNETKDFLRNTTFIHELLPTALEMEDDEEYFEFSTLAEVHQFCQKPGNNDTEVFYIHSKTRDDLRNKLEHYLLGKKCVECLSHESKMACGPNHILGFYWEHFSGNFWMSRCSHIVNLNFPFQQKILDEEKEDHHPAVYAVPPYGRYFAEYWLLNDEGDRGERTFQMAEGLLEKNEVCSNTHESLTGTD